MTPSPMTETAQRSDMVERVLDAYWSAENNHLTISSKHRMVPVLQTIAEEIRTWGPPEEQARIWNRAINEVADRLLRECEAIK